MLTRGLMHRLDFFVNNERINLFEGLTLDLARGSVVRSGEPVHLRPQTYEVLKYLVENRGHLISKDKLIEEVWEGRAVTDGSLGKCIEELREALGPEAREYLRNVRGRGYIFDAGVEDRDQREALPTVSEQVDVVRVTVEDHEEIAGSRQGLAPALTVPRAVKRFRTAAFAIAGALVLIVVGIVGYRLFFSRAPASTPIKSIAVLPFKNESGNPDVEYLSDGMTESLINNLSQLPNLSVKARSTVFRFKGMEPQQAASELSVQAILNGRVVQRGDDLTLYLSLVDGRNGNQIWGDQYSRKLTDLVALQQEITRDVSQKLRAQLSRSDEQKLAKNYAANSQAYQLYLKGRYHVLKLTLSEIQIGISYFQEAIASDPSYALAYVGLADAYRSAALAGDLPPAEFLSKAKVTAQKAIEIEDAQADAHAELGFIIFWYDWDWNAAENQFKRALELDPNSADAHLFYAHLLSNTGRHTEALTEVARARELDPLNLRTNALEALFLIHAGRVDEALASLQNTFELDPNYWPAHQFAAGAYIEKGMFPQAVVEAQKAAAYSPSPTNSFASGFLGYALAKSGREAEARTLVADLIKASKNHYVGAYNIALICDGLGEREEALNWLERGYEQRDQRMVFLKVEPKWNNLRSEPRFQSLLRRLGLDS